MSVLCQTKSNQAFTTTSQPSHWTHLSINFLQLPSRCSCLSLLSPTPALGTVAQSFPCERLPSLMTATWIISLMSLWNSPLESVSLSAWKSHGLIPWHLYLDAIPLVILHSSVAFNGTCRVTVPVSILR